MRKYLTSLIIFLFILSLLASGNKNYEKLGDSNFNAKNYKKAEKYYKKALKKDSRNPQLHFKLALTYKYRGKMDKCLKELIRCTQIDKNFEKPYIFLADFFTLTKKYDKAEKAYLNLIRIKPNSPKYHYLYGKLLFKIHKDEKALKQFYKTVKLDRGFNEAYPFLKELLKREILKNPDNPEPHLKLGNIFYYNGELQKAKVQYLIVLNKTPNREKVWYKLLKICKELKECDCTIKTYEALLEFYPSSEEILRDIREWCIKCGNFEKAIKYMKKEYGIYPEKSFLLKKIGDLYLNQKNELEAYYYYRLYLKKNKDEKIDKWCKNIELVNPSISLKFNSLFFFNKGVKLFKEGNFNGALNLFKKAKSIYSDYPQLHYYLGRAEYEMGDIRKSLFEYKEAILKDKYNPEYWFYLGLSLNDLKRYKDAAICFKKVLDFSTDKNSIFFKASYKYLKKYASSGIIEKDVGGYK